MMPGDLSTRNDHHRANRHADDERARIERLAREAPLREAGIRVPAEPPPQRDVERFQSLLSGRGGARTTEADPQRAPASSDSEAKPKGDAEAVATAPIPDESLAHRDVTRRDGTGNSSRDVGTEDKSTGASEPSATEASSSDTPNETARSAMASASRNDGTAPAHADSKSADNEASIEGEENSSTRSAETPTGTRHASRPEHEEPAAIVAVVRGSRDSTSSASDKETTKALDSTAVPTQISAEVASLVQTHRLALDAPQQAAMTASAMAPALAELIEKHVKQMLVSATSSSRLRAREVLLRMQGDVLPGTDLWLTRTANGWQLRADVRSRDAYDVLLASSKDLIRRFADGALGELTIEPMYHGDDGVDRSMPRTPKGA